MRHHRLVRKIEAALSSGPGRAGSKAQPHKPGPLVTVAPKPAAPSRKRKVKNSVATSTVGGDAGFSNSEPNDAEPLLQRKTRGIKKNYRETESFLSSSSAEFIESDDGEAEAEEDEADEYDDEMYAEEEIQKAIAAKKKRMAKGPFTNFIERRVLEVSKAKLPVTPKLQQLPFSPVSLEKLYPSIERDDLLTPPTSAKRPTRPMVVTPKAKSVSRVEQAVGTPGAMLQSGRPILIPRQRSSLSTTREYQTAIEQSSPSIRNSKATKPLVSTFNAGRTEIASITPEDSISNNGTVAQNSGSRKFLAPASCEDISSANATSQSVGV